MKKLMIILLLIYGCESQEQKQTRLWNQQARATMGQMYKGLGIIPQIDYSSYDYDLEKIYIMNQIAEMLRENQRYQDYYIPDLSTYFDNYWQETESMLNVIRMNRPKRMFED